MFHLHVMSTENHKLGAAYLLAIMVLYIAKVVDKPLIQRAGMNRTHGLIRSFSSYKKLSAEPIHDVESMVDLEVLTWLKNGRAKDEKVDI